MKIFPEMTRSKLPEQERKRRWKQLEDTYLAQQIDCYPENYVIDHPSVDRILETVEKFEEDLTDQCTIHGNLKVIIDVCEPIEVCTQRVRGVAEDPLMTAIRESLTEKAESAAKRIPDVRCLKPRANYKLRLEYSLEKFCQCLFRRGLGNQRNGNHGDGGCKKRGNHGMIFILTFAKMQLDRVVTNRRPIRFTEQV